MQYELGQASKETPADFSDIIIITVVIIIIIIMVSTYLTLRCLILRA